MKGFHVKWCQWIEDFVQGGSIRIRVNDDIVHYFQTKEDLREGNPQYPMLFNIVIDMLDILIARCPSRKNNPLFS
jgi:hypothetical protein